MASASFVKGGFYDEHYLGLAHVPCRHVSVLLLGRILCLCKCQSGRAVVPRPLPTLDRSLKTEHIATIYPSLSGSLEHIHLVLIYQDKEVRLE